jgi:hypothetical protein
MLTLNQEQRFPACLADDSSSSAAMVAYLHLLALAHTADAGCRPIESAAGTARARWAQDARTWAPCAENACSGLT